MGMGRGTREMIERTHLVRMTIGVDEETGEPYTREELVKPLTDEEIREFITVFPIIFTPMDLLAFARAILRKAQEK